MTKDTMMGRVKVKAVTDIKRKLVEQKKTETNIKNEVESLAKRTGVEIMSISFQWLRDKSCKLNLQVA